MSNDIIGNNAKLDMQDFLINTIQDVLKDLDKQSKKLDERLEKLEHLTETLRICIRDKK